VESLWTNACVVSDPSLAFPSLLLPFLVMLPEGEMLGQAFDQRDHPVVEWGCFAGPLEGGSSC